MTDKRKVQLEAGFDASGVGQGARQAEAAVADMARKIGAHGAEAARGIDGVGAAGATAAEKLDKSTSNIVASIQRQTAALQAGERGTASFYEQLSKTRGLDLKVLEPYLAQLREAEKLHRVAAGGVDAIGVSARQTAAALRGVPAQFTDIITSLQGGQQPLTVLLQQGGQLKDMFGGVGAAVKALGGYVAGLINPFTLLGAAAGVALYGFVKGGQEATEYTRALTLSGNAAGTTAAQLEQMARAVAATSSATQGNAAGVLAALVAEGRVASDMLERVARAALELERVGGPAVQKTVDAFSELGRAPLQASLKLNESTNFLTRSLYEQIKALEDQGRTTEAARVAQDAYAGAVEQRVPQIVQSLGLVEQAWKGIKAAAAGAADVVLDVGRSTLQTEIASLEAAISTAKRLQSGSGTGLLDALARRREASLTEELNALREVERLTRRSAEAQAERNRANQQGIEWAKEGEKYLSKEAQYTREVLRIREQGLAVGASELEIAQRIAAARERVMGKPGEARAVNDAWASLSREINKATEAAEAELGAAGRLSEARKLQIDLANKLAAAAGRMTDAQRREAAAAIARAVDARAAVELQKARIASEKDRIASVQRTGRALLDYAASVAEAEAEIEQWLERERRASLQGVEAAESRLQRLDDEARAATLARAANMSLAEAIERVALARLEEQRAQFVNDPQRLAALEREIQLRRQIIAAVAQGEARKANDDAAREAAAAWQRTADQIGQSLADALMQGGRSAWDYVKSYVRTQVLRPVVQAAAAPLTGLLAGLVGTPAAASQPGAVAGLGSLFGGGSFGTGAYGLGNVLYPGGGIGGVLASGFNSIAYSSLGQSLGLSTAGAGLEAAALTSAGSGISSALAAVGPYAAALAAIYALAKGLDKSGTPHLGSVVTADSSGVRTGGDDPGGVLRNLNQQTDAALKLITGSSVELLNIVGKTFGVAGSYAAQAKFTADGVDPTFAGFQLFRDGVRVGESAGVINHDAAHYSSDREAAFTAFSADVAATVRAALDRIDLPDWARQQFEALGDGTDLDKLRAVAQQVAETQGAFDALQATLEPFGGSFARLAGLSSDALASLSGLAGGLQQLQGGLDTYFREFFSEQERTAMETARLGRTLAEVGVQTPATREAFRSLAESQDLTTESGRRTYATLLSVSGVFAELHPVVEVTTDSTQELVEATTDLGDELRRQAEVARERAGLEQTLLRLRGDTTGLRERELAALDASNRALQETIYQIEDSTAAQAAYQRSLQDIEAAAERVRGATDAVRTALQSVADYGQGIRTRIAETESALESVRTRAASALEVASGRVVTALGAMSSAATDSARRVQQAAADVQAALDRQAAAAGSVSSWLDQQRQAVGSTREAVGDLLASMAQAARESAASAAATLSGLIRGQQTEVTQARAGVSSALAQLLDTARSAAASELAVRLRITDAYTVAQDAHTAAVARLAEIEGRSTEVVAELNDGLARLSESIDAYLQELTGSSVAATLQPGVARAQFEDVAGRARAGDPAAQAQLLASARQLIDASRAGSTSGAAFDADVRRVRQVLGSLGAAASAAAAAQRGAVEAPATGADAAAQIAAARADVARTLAEVERLRAVAQASGADLTRANVDLMAEWRQAQQAATAAQQAYEAATGRAQAAGVGLPGTASAFDTSLQALSSAQTQLEEMLSRVAASGVDLALADTRDELQRTIDSYRQAQAAYAAAAAQAQALGITATEPVDSFRALLVAATAAREAWDAALQQVQAAGVDLSLADTRSEVQRLVDEYREATAAVAAARVGYQQASATHTEASAALDEALHRAAAAGVDYAATVTDAGQQFGEALRVLRLAQEEAGRVGDPATAASLASEYEALTLRLGGLRAELVSFEERVTGLDFSSLQALDPLGDLLQTYADAVADMLEATRQQAQLTETGRFVDIGGGFSKYTSTGGAVAIQQAGVTGLTLIGRDGRVYGESGLKQWVADQYAAGNFEAIYREATAFGISSDDLQKLTGTGTAVLSWARAMGLPAFAAGSAYVPRTTLATVHEGERIFTAADNARIVQAVADGAGMAEAVVQLVGRLDRVEAQRAADAQAQVASLQRVQALLQQIAVGGVGVYNAPGEAALRTEAA